MKMIGFLLDIPMLENRSYIIRFFFLFFDKLNKKWYNMALFLCDEIAIIWRIIKWGA